MKILVLEWLSSQPRLHREGANEQPTNLRDEGLAMLAVLIEGLVSGGHEVTTLLPVDSGDQNNNDETLEQKWISRGVRAERMEAASSAEECEYAVLNRWQHLASAAQVAWLVAPEIDNLLGKAVDRLSPLVKLVNCKPPALDCASDKWLTADAFARHGVNHPETQLLSHLGQLGQRCSSEARLVAKRRDGAGCEGTRLLSTNSEIVELIASAAAPADWILQRWINSDAYSISAFVGPYGTTWMNPVRQNVIPTVDGLHFAGAELTTCPPKRDELLQTAESALKSLGGGLLGWIGIDLLYSTQENCWYAIEINPRLTSSCVELAAAHDDNLINGLFQRCFLGVDGPDLSNFGAISRFDRSFSSQW